MKCIILAGGIGNSLWPLSRKNYPKQFMNIRKGRSLLQDTIVRNMPFADEFIIVTNESYYDIIEGQMKVFQGLTYRIIYEAVPCGTLPAVTFAGVFLNSSELMMVTVSDLVIGEGNYKDSILEAKKIANDGGIANLYNSDGSGHIGLFICQAGIFLNEVRKSFSDIYKACRNFRKKIRTVSSSIHITSDIVEHFSELSVQRDLFNGLKGLHNIDTDFCCSDIDTIFDVNKLDSSLYKENVIENKCDNVCVINTAGRHLIVANDINDIAIVNTDDATYISSEKAVGNIKGIISEQTEEYGNYFENNKVSYRSWGIHELLASTDNYKVKRVTVYPGMGMNMHRHEHRSEHWSVVDGTATVVLDGAVHELNRFDEITIPMGASHKVMNGTDRNVVIIETGIGDILSETDFHNVENDGNQIYIPDLIKREPAFKDNLWGGTKLRTVFGKKCDYDIIAESWELSAHPAGQSVIADGVYAGMFFGEFIEKIGKSSLGWKCASLESFPILIKFIDAMKPLSIQIHPDDDYALENENEYGKNEMWYVVDCEPGAFLYCGLNRKVDKDELRTRIENNTITEVLNKIEVKPGDCVFVKAGTIHAIGAGILICEIQQNSNSTYRMYDYDRRDRFGNARELHIDKALDVVDTEPYVFESYEDATSDSEYTFTDMNIPPVGGAYITASRDVSLDNNTSFLETAQSVSSSDKVAEVNSDAAGTGIGTYVDKDMAVSIEGDFFRKLLVRCKYFQCEKYDVYRQARIAVDTSSFLSIIVISGTAKISVGADSKGAKAGESFFVTAGNKTVVIDGACECVVTRI